MTREANEEFVRNTFEEARARLSRAVTGLVDDPEAAVAQAATIFEGMIPTMAYVDKPRHPMASAVFDCNANLAVYLVVKELGVDVHDFGGAILNDIAETASPEPQGPKDERPAAERFAGFAASAEASQKDALPGEFVFEAFLGDRKDFDWGTNITSCAICSAYSQHDAMDLVPYMCASDDVVSDRDGQGLRRKGTIATGARRCDFRYKRGGEPLRIAEQHPDQIRFERKGR